MVLGESSSELLTNDKRLLFARLGRWTTDGDQDVARSDLGRVPRDERVVLPVEHLSER